MPSTKPRRAKPSLTASILQYLLFAACLVLIVATAYGATFLYGVLTTKATETNHAKIDAELAEDEITRLKRLHETLQVEKPQIEKTAKIVAESQKYQYQDQVVNDINSYARSAEVQVMSYDFQQATSASAPSAATPSATPAPSGLKKTSVTITLTQDTPYDRLYKFLRHVERNVTKMQLTKVALQPNPDNPSLIANPSLTMEMYLR